MKNCELIERLQLLNPLSDIYVEIECTGPGKIWLPIDNVQSKQIGDDGSIILKRSFNGDATKY